MIRALFVALRLPTSNRAVVNCASVAQPLGLPAFGRTNRAVVNCASVAQPLGLPAFGRTNRAVVALRLPTFGLASLRQDQPRLINPTRKPAGRRPLPPSGSRAGASAHASRLSSRAGSRAMHPEAHHACPTRGSKSRARGRYPLRRRASRRLPYRPGSERTRRPKQISVESGRLPEFLVSFFRRVRHGS